MLNLSESIRLPLPYFLLLFFFFFVSSATHSIPGKCRVSHGASVPPTERGPEAAFSSGLAG